MDRILERGKGRFLQTRLTDENVCIDKSLLDNESEVGPHFRFKSATNGAACQDGQSVKV